jgi:signal transduction histidine kinase
VDVGHRPNHVNSLSLFSLASVIISVIIQFNLTWYQNHKSSKLGFLSLSISWVSGYQSVPLVFCLITSLAVRCIFFFGGSVPGVWSAVLG